MSRIPKAPLTDNKWYYKGSKAYFKGDYKKAINAYKEALKIDKNHKHAWNELGLSHLKL